MNGQNQSSTSSCNIHPIEFTEGVCPLCLNERLLVLASLQRLQSSSPPDLSDQTIHKPNIIFQNSSKNKNIKLFSFDDLFEQRHDKSDHRTTSIISPEDSFISINFEDNGATSWEKESCELEHCKTSCDSQYRQVMLHTKKNEITPQLKPRHLLTWRKRISRLLHVISFKNKSSHVSAKVKGDDDLNKNWLKTPKLITSKNLQ